MPLSAEREAYRRKVFDATVEWLAESLPLRRSWRVLEVGAGRNAWASLYLEHFDDVVAADLNDFSADNPGVSYVVADITHGLPLPDQSIDLAVSHSMLEHVHDIGAALRNINRVLAVGGHVFLTVAPLYYSAEGAHMRSRGITRWEHLDPAHPIYMTTSPFPEDPEGGHFLNRMKWTDVLSDIGRQPWEIVRTKLMIDRQPLAPWLDLERHSEFDLRCRGFFLLARRIWYA